METIEEQIELLKELDKDYFHVCIEYKEDGKPKKWVVYYNNLYTLEYIKKNKPILTSKEHKKEDILLLGEKMKNLKQKTKINNIADIVDTAFCILDLKRTVEKKIDNIWESINIILFTLYLGLLLSGIDKIIIATAAVVIILVQLSLPLIVIYIKQKIRKIFDNTVTTMHDKLIKMYLKDRDMKELKDEFKKKSGKKQTKTDETK